MLLFMLIFSVTHERQIFSQKLADRTTSSGSLGSFLCPCRFDPPSIQINVSFSELQLDPVGQRKGKTVPFYAKKCCMQFHYIVSVLVVMWKALSVYVVWPSFPKGELIIT